MSHLHFRSPQFIAKSVHGGLWASAAGLTTSVSSATGTLASIDTHSVVSGKRFEGVKVDVPVQVILDSGQSLTVSLKIEHSSASSGTYADLGATGYSSTTLSNTATSTGVTTRGVATVSRSLVSAKRYVRVKARRQGSAADTGGDIQASAFTVNFFRPSVTT